MRRITKHRSYLAACIMLLITTACSTHSGPASVKNPSSINSAATVIVDETHTMGSLPTDFLGFSYEARILPAVTSFQTRQGNLVALYDLLGQGNIRIGGRSVDREAFWQPGNLTVPSWARTVIKPADMYRLAQFARMTGWKVELTVNLGHLDPSNVDNEARYAAAYLGSQLEALECGNEPNDFAEDLRPTNYDATQYAADFATCASAIGQSAAIAGPDTTGAFMADFSHFSIGHITMLTQHLYPLNNCNGDAGTASDLLSAATDQLELKRIANTMKIASTASLPVRLDESNSVTCGGLAGVSDTYASTLWAVDYLLLMAQNGIAGVNFHGGLELCHGSYTPLCASSREALQSTIFTPQPIYYGMLFTSMLGTGQFYPVRVSTTDNLTAYAVHGNDGKTRVMLVEKDDPSSDPLSVTLFAGSATSQAQVLHLSGPALSSTQGVNIQGAMVDQSGHFVPNAPDLIQGNNGVYTLSLAAGSAALITLPS